MARNNHFPGSTGHVPVNMDQDAVGFLFASRTFSLLWSQFNKILKSFSTELIFSNHSSAVVQPHLLFQWHCSFSTACGDLVPLTCFPGRLRLCTYTWGGLFFTLFYNTWGLIFSVILHLLLPITVDLYIMTKSPFSILGWSIFQQTDQPGHKHVFCPTLPSGLCFSPAVPHPLQETYSCWSQTLSPGPAVHNEVLSHRIHACSSDWACSLLPPARDQTILQLQICQWWESSCSCQSHNTQRSWLWEFLVSTVSGCSSFCAL